MKKPNQSNSPTNSQNDDMDIPMFPFDPLKERNSEEENNNILKRSNTEKTINSKES